MPGSVDVQVFVHDESVHALLTRLDTALNPVAVAGFLSGSIDPYIRGRARRRFQMEGDDVSGKWAPLLPATQAIRAQEGYGASHPINRREGQLQDYITGSPNALTVTPLGAVLTMPGKVATGELARKMTTAQQGRTQTPVTEPRPVIGLNEKDLAFILESLALYVVNPATGGKK